MSFLFLFLYKKEKLKFYGINERYFSAYLRFEVIDKPGVYQTLQIFFQK